MYHLDNLIAVHNDMTPIDCAQGENAPSTLLGPPNVKRSLPYSEERYRSRFQDANNDTSGKKVDRLTGKKRGRGDDGGDGNITIRDKTSIVDSGNYHVFPPNIPSESNTDASDTGDIVSDGRQCETTAIVVEPHLQPHPACTSQTVDAPQPESESSLTSWLHSLIGR